jgi:hypothetical protein
MLSALRGVLRECWHSGLLSFEQYQAAVDVEPVRGESESRGRTSRLTSCVGCSRPVPERRSRSAFLADRPGRRATEALQLFLGVADQASILERAQGRDPAARSPRPAPYLDWRPARGRRGPGHGPETVQRKAAAQLDIPYLPAEE